MSEQWLTSLITETPQEGYELAIKLSRMGIKYTQPSDAVRSKLRPDYSENSENLIASSPVSHSPTTFNPLTLVKILLIPTRTR